MRSTAGQQYLRARPEPLIVIVERAEVERELGDLARRHHVIVAGDKSALDPVDGFSLDQMDWQGVVKAS